MQPIVTVTETSRTTGFYGLRRHMPVSAYAEHSREGMREVVRKVSQTLTSAESVRYCPTMTAWSSEQRTHALDLLRNGNTLAATARTTGIPKQTLSGWAKAEGLDLNGRSEAKTREATQAAQRKWAEVRAELADQSGDAARRLLAIISRAIDSGDMGITSARDAKDAATAMAILIDKAQLLGGGATSRTETITAVDAELEALTAALRHNDRADA